MRLARATAGMTRIVASRQRREMVAIDVSHTSPIATVDPVDERRDGHPHGIVSGHADEAAAKHPQA